MIKVLEVLLPVAAMIGIGMCCRRFHLLSRAAIDGLKFLITKIILPIAILNALATVSYSVSTFGIILIMFVMLIVSFGAGFLMRPLMAEPYRKYLPFMVSVYEGGMIAYPLYTNLVGAENISHIALLDIAALLFGFSVYMSMLTQTEEGKPLEARQLLHDAFRNNSFVAAILGLLLGLSGIVLRLQASVLGSVYNAVISLITQPMSAMILVIVGYEIVPEKALLRPCLQTILLRALLQGLMIFCVLTAVHSFVGRNTLTDLAIISYMSAPATFSMQSFLKSKDASAYASTTNSLYCFVSIAVYAALAAIYL